MQVLSGSHWQMLKCVCCTWTSRYIWQRLAGRQGGNELQTCARSPRASDTGLALQPAGYSASHLLCPGLLQLKQYHAEPKRPTKLVGSRAMCSVYTAHCCYLHHDPNCWKICLKVLLPSPQLQHTLGQTCNDFTARRLTHAYSTAACFITSMCRSGGHHQTTHSKTLQTAMQYAAIHKMLLALQVSGMQTHIVHNVHWPST